LQKYYYENYHPIKSGLTNAGLKMIHLNFLIDASQVRKFYFTTIHAELNESGENNVTEKLIDINTTSKR
jgi:hypothetical protein